jgi:hypothetical protein
MLDTTSGTSLLCSARSIAAVSGRGMRASIGAEKIRGEFVPQGGQLTCDTAVPIGKLTSKLPSRGQRYSYVATPVSLYRTNFPGQWTAFSGSESAPSGPACQRSAGERAALAMAAPHTGFSLNAG